MKALFVNASPRKNWNTHKMLTSAMQGAQDVGAECELVNLYDAPFKGCVSCFVCKLKNAKTHGLCAFKDALTPTLEKALAADVLVAGSPVYFSYPTGMFRSFIERLLFPIMSYNVNPSRYDAGMFSEPVKAKYRDEHFPTDLRKAYELGKRLTEKAKA